MTLAPLSEGEDRLARWVELLAPARQLAEVLAGTEFVPTAMRGKPDAITATILYGDEVAIGPMQAMVGIHVVEGRPAPSAELMRALILRAGHTFTVHEMTGARCRVSGLRAGRPEQERAYVEWTTEMARSAGLLGRQNWQRYPRAMLLARATGDLSRMLFPDVIKGLGHMAEDDSNAAELDTWRATASVTDADPGIGPPERVARKTRPQRRTLGTGAPRPEDRPPVAPPTPELAEPPPSQPETAAGAVPPDEEEEARIAQPPTEPPPEPTADEAPIDQPPPDELTPEATAPAEPPARGVPPQVASDRLLAAVRASCREFLGSVPNKDLDHQQRVELLSVLIERPIESSGHLTRAEAMVALTWLGKLNGGEAGTWRDDEGVLHVQDFPKTPVAKEPRHKAAESEESLWGEGSDDEPDPR